MKYKWMYHEDIDPTEVTNIASKFKLPDAIASILLSRVGKVDADIVNYLNVGLHQLSSPMVMNNIWEAAEAIFNRIQSGKVIVVFGDYDSTNQ